MNLRAQRLPEAGTSHCPAIPQLMRAWAAEAYGGPEVLRLREVPLAPPAPHELLVKVEATTVSSADRRIRAMAFPAGMHLLGRAVFGLRRPRRPVLGVEAAGVVLAVGNKVQRFRPGEPVIAFTGARTGAHAEYLRIAGNGLVVPRPPRMPLAEAAALGFGGLTACDFLRRAALRKGDRMLVIGATGTVGSALVQLGAALGARITAVSSAANLSLARSLGADDAVAYDEGGMDLGGERFEVVADAVGAIDFDRSLDLLVDGGRYLAIDGALGDMLARSRKGRRCIAGPAAERLDDLAALLSLHAGGRYRPLIDSQFAFEDMQQAHARVDSGHKRGSVVVLLDAAVD